MVPLQSLLPKINEHLPPEIRVIGESTFRTLIDLLESYTILLVYKSTFYDQKLDPKDHPRLRHESYTKT